MTAQIRQASAIEQRPYDPGLPSVSALGMYELPDL